MPNKNHMIQDSIDKCINILFIVFQFDDLVEVFTDKLVAKIPSSTDGTVVEIKIAADQACLVGHSLLSIRVDDGAEEEVAAASSSSSSSDEEETVQPQAPAAASVHKADSGPGKWNSIYI